MLASIGRPGIAHVFRAGWVPVTEFDWLEELRVRHDGACGVLRAAVVGANRVAVEVKQARQAHYASVVAAVRSGGPRPAAFDDVVARARLDVAGGDLLAAAGGVCDVVDAVAGVLNARRGELVAWVEGEFGPAPSRALVPGGEFEEWQGRQRAAAARVAPVEVLIGNSYALWNVAPLTARVRAEISSARSGAVAA